MMNSTICPVCKWIIPEAMWDEHSWEHLDRNVEELEELTDSLKNKIETRIELKQKNRCCVCNEPAIWLIKNKSYCDIHWFRKKLIEQNLRSENVRN